MTRLAGGSLSDRLRRVARSIWFGHRQRPRELQLCETLSLGERRFVGVIQYRKQRFLVGGTSSNIALLAQLPLEDKWEDR